MLHSKLGIALLVSAALGLASTAGAAQTYDAANALNTWNASDANWLTGATWENLLTSDAIFAGTGESVAVTTVNARDITFNSTGYTLTGSTITLGPTSLITANADASISSILAGAGTSLTKAGSGKLTLSGVNSYTGQTIVNGGTLLVNTTGAGNGTGTLDKTSGILVSAGTLEFSGGSSKDGIGRATTGTNKTITVSSGATLKTSSNNVMGYNSQEAMANVVLNGGTFTVGALTYVNTLTLNTGATVNGGSDIEFYYANQGITANDDASITAGIRLVEGVTTTSSIQVADTKTLTITGRITNYNGGTNNSYGITKTGNGTLFLNNSSASNYGGVTVISAGTLKIGSGTALGSTNNGTSVTAGAVLDLNGQTVGAEALTLNGTGISSGGALVNSAVTAASLSGAVNLASATSIGGVGNITLSGAISGAGNLTKSGSGTLNLSGTNNYDGVTSVSSGTLRLGSASALGTSGNGTSVTAGAVLDLNGQTVGAEALTLNGTGISSGGALVNSAGTAASLSGAVNLASATSIGGSGNITLSGGISGTGKLTKVGSGNLTVSNGGNSYSGGTTVGEGTLTVDAAGAIQVGSAGANVTVASGATLAINGRLELASGATIANSGTITFANGIIDLNGVFDGQANGGTYALITGTMATGTADVIGYTPGTASFDAATGLITFTAIPEPATYGLLGAGALGLAALRRRKRAAV